jgi:hypothetical protein
MFVGSSSLVALLFDALPLTDGLLMNGERLGGK